MKAILLASLALSGCAAFQSNAKYTYQRVGDDCTLVVDSGREFAAGIDVKLTGCDVEVTAGKVSAQGGNTIRDAVDLAREIKGGSSKDQ